jgi:NAD(P)-dependent dehydrogenase (short-subunit alcohol dehydrogenase family)
MSSTSSLPVVFVVGASRGLGLSIVEILLNGSKTLEPANVVSLSRSQTDAINKLTLNQRSSKTSLIAVQGDASNDNDCKNAIDQAIQKWGRLDAIILNAGTIEYARFANGKPEDLVNQISSNVAMILKPIHHSIPHLRSSPTGCGKAVFVSSGASTGQTAAWGAYNASKAAMNAIARTLANEEKSLAVWAVRPGVVDTEVSFIIFSLSTAFLQSFFFPFIQMQKSIREKAKEAMDPKEYVRFEEMHRDGKLLPPNKPGHVLAALAIRGTRSHPTLPNEKEGAGAKGAYINWEAEELQDFQLPQ